MTVVPQDTAAERLVIAACLDHTAYEVACASGLTPTDDHDHVRVLREVNESGLTAGDFMDQRCALVFKAFEELTIREWPITYESVYRFCRASKNPARHIPADWLNTLSLDLPTTYGVGWWATRVAQLAKQRRVMAAADAIARDGDPGRAVALIQAVAGDPPSPTPKRTRASARLSTRVTVDYDPCAVCKAPATCWGPDARPYCDGHNPNDIVWAVTA